MHGMGSAGIEGRPFPASYVPSYGFKVFIPYPSGQHDRIMASDATPQAKEAAARLVELRWADQNHAHEQQQHDLRHVGSA